MGSSANDIHCYIVIIQNTQENIRVTVIETSTGEKLTGEDAPKKSELEEWLKEHPGYAML